MQVAITPKQKVMPVDSWPSWRANGNVIQLTGQASANLLHNFFVAGMLNAILFLVFAIFSDRIPIGTSTGIGFWIALPLSAFFGAASVLFGIICTLVVVVFDQSMGKYMSSLTFGVAATGLSQAPLATFICAPSVPLYQSYPEIPFCIFAIAVLTGAVVGLFGFEKRWRDASSLTSFTFRVRHLLVLTAWLGLPLTTPRFALTFFINATIVITLVSGVVISYRLLRFCRLNS